MDTQLLSYAQVAQLMGLPLGTVYSMVSRRQIPHVRLSPRLVRFSPSAIDQWLADRLVHPLGQRHDP